MTDSQQLQEKYLLRPVLVCQRARVKLGGCPVLCSERLFEQKRLDPIENGRKIELWRVKTVFVIF